MLLALTAIAFASPQEPPPPVDVPRRVAEEVAAPQNEITLFDGFDALERLHHAWRWRDKEATDDADARARADAALAHWCRDERRAAVEGWIRLALELEGKDSPEELLAACLRLELIDGDRPTRIRRGFFSAGMGGHRAPYRVRALFDVPELAETSFQCSVQIVDLLFGPPNEGDPRRADSTLRIDGTGSVRPTNGSIQAGPAGSWDLDVQLLLALPGEEPTPVDSVVIENGGLSDKGRRAALRKIAGLDDGWKRRIEDDPLTAAIRRALAARIELLTGAASLERSAEFLARFNHARDGFSSMPEELVRRLGLPLSSSLQEEAEALRDGRLDDPPLLATARNGPVWRTYALGEEREVAAWTRCASDDACLVIVLHPEGFDEGWAVRLTGGDLFRAARDRDVTLVAPETGPLAADLDALPRLVDAIALEVAVGELHLVGAGAGADLARQLAERHPELVAEVHALPSGLSGAPYSVLDAFGQLLRALE